MSEKKQSLLGGIRQRFGEFSGDFVEMLSLRVQLAHLEIESDLLAARRVSIVLSVCGVTALTALPLLATALAVCLEGIWGIALHGWLAIFGVTMLSVAAAVGLFSWKRFRSNLIGLKHTREELREDLEWLRELRGSKE